ncbi:hypothetical protein J8M20_23065 [Pseudoalteromonas luteoviolacea]|uniref:ATP-binding protein n=1 Tax=Pseudoalteromonas luteoviolacea TaxID=43657 RepID=UPI001B358EC1|nr:ATP-binding protein [Pseudoalteromonas luteoviolacea]MBQ4814267.1 hypothetical protein [Pseudoalteromonas luteoviolacea]
MRALKYLFALVLSANCSSMQLKHLNTVVQDESQFMYFSSHDGVYRYDGEHFIGLNRFTELPKGMVKDIQILDKSDSLIVLYQNGELWKVNLSEHDANKIAEIDAYKLSIHSGNLFALLDKQVVHIDISNGAIQTVFNKDIKLFDMDAGYGHMFFLSEDGLYVYSELGVRKVADSGVYSGDIEATPIGVAYTINSKLFHYTHAHRSSIESLEVTSADNLTFMPPHHLYFTSGGNVSELNINTLQVTRKNIASKSMSYRNLFVDNNDTLWGVGINSFMRVDGQNKISDIQLDSQYNSIEYVNGELWIGTSKGIYKFLNNQLVKVDWLNERMPRQEYSINSFELFSGHLIISTSLGAFKANVNTKSFSKLVDDYVINASIIQNNLYLSTNTAGIKVFSNQFTQLDASQFNDSLPSLEVLNVDRYLGKTYISTAGGLVVTDASGNSILDFEHSVMVTDIAVLSDKLFLSTYGKGLFKKHENEWVAIPSPSHIVELSTDRNEIFIKTTNGLHKVDSSHAYTTAIQGTLQNSFSTSSIKSIGSKLLAVSDKAIIEIPRAEEKKPTHPMIVAIESEVGLIPEPSELILEQGEIRIALSALDLYSEVKGVYQYSHNNSDWITLDSAMLTLSGLKETKHDLRFRYSKGNEVSDVTEFQFRVTAHPLKSNLAIAIYLLIIIAAALAGFFFVYKWVQSFHTVYRKNHKHFQQTSITETYVNMVDAKALCGSGNDTMLTEGLVKLGDILDKLEPIAHDIASLGNQPLSAGINILQIHASMQLAMNVKIKSTVGEERFDNQLEHDIYSVLYQTVRNAIKHSRAKNVSASLLLLHNSIEVCVEDDGKGISFMDRLNFGSGFYHMKQIAKVYKTKLSIKTSKKGSTISMVFPIIERARPVNEPRKQEFIEKI